jgi:predicted permease
VVAPELRDDVSGDLVELFHRDWAALGARRAQRRYWRNVLSCSIRLGAERCRMVLRGGVLRVATTWARRKAALSTLVGWRMDVTLAVRMLIRHPALSSIAVVGIAVAIAIAATMVTLIGAQVNPPDLPLPDGDRIVVLQRWDAANYRSEPLVQDDLAAWREQLSMVRELSAFRTVTKNLIVPPAVPEPIAIAEMSSMGFTVAGVDPVIGRVIQPEDELATAPPIVVIGYAEWQRRFGGRSDVLTTSVQLGDTHHAVVGVMPEGFAFPINHAYWIPLREPSSNRSDGAEPTLSVFGRLAGSASLQSAQAELAAIGNRTRAETPTNRQDIRPRVVPYARQFSETDQPGNRLALQLVRFLVGILLAVVSINVAVLVYARTAARQTEISVRTALGASRGRIVAQLFVEGLVLAGLGALGGITVANIALAQIQATLSQREPVPFWIRFDLSEGTILSIVALTVASAAIIGAVPAWKATGSRMQNRLQMLGAGGGAGMHLGRLWTALLLFQVAFAVALLPMVLVRMSELAREGMGDFGFAAGQFVVAQVSIDPTAGAPLGSIEAATGLATRYRDMEQRIVQTGNVLATTFSIFAPGFESAALVRSDRGAAATSVQVNRVGVNFFDTFRVPVLAGRGFLSADAAPESRTVVVNSAFAHAASSGGTVLGSRLRPIEPRNVPMVTGLTDDWFEIVGIVEDFPVRSSATANPAPKVYRALAPEAADAVTMALLRQPGDHEAWGTRLRQIAADIDPSLQISNVTAMDELLSEHQRPARLLAASLAGMTVSVLLLSAAGIYAMMAFSVTQRRREIGIRLALGAGTRRILWTIFSRAGGQLMAGAGLGMAVASLLDRAAQGGLLRGHATIAISTVIALLVMTGLLAALGPARQGLRIEPTEAMRDPSR